MTRLSKSKQRLLNSKMSYLYKEKKDIKELTNFNLTDEDIQKKHQQDELLKSSMIVINQSIDAKKLIESVIEKMDHNKQVLEELAESKQMRGHVYKAYSNLFNKGKQVDEKEIVAKKIKNREEMYDHVYFKLPKNSKNVKKSTAFHPFLVNED
jgi:DNA polymerase III delta prime subunit